MKGLGKFDKQFVFFLFQNIMIGIFSMIDAAFGNHINIDSVCVFSAFTVIGWATYSAYNIGSYAYRVFLGKAKACLVIQMAMSLFLLVLIYVLSPKIPYLYALTESQNILFIDCLKIHALSQPVFALREYLGNYVEYQCKNKAALTGNIILYVSMIITDAIVICINGDLRGLLWCTLLSSVIYSIYELYASGFLKEPNNICKDDLIVAAKHGWNICFDRLTGKVATIVFNIYASKLGTMLYAIHGVCYSIGVFTEHFTNALYAYMVVRCGSESGSRNKMDCCIRILKKYIFFIIGSSYCICFGVLLFVHGSVPLLNCLRYVGLYCTEIFALLLYEPMKAYLTSEGLTKYLKFGGVVGICVRIPLVLIGYTCGFGLYTFALATTIDFFIRGVYFLLAGLSHLKAINKNQINFEHTREVI